MALKTIYCVQTYGRKRADFVKGPLRQFGSPEDALGVARDLSQRVAGVVVFSVEGEPAFGYWSDPCVLAAFGEVPPLEA